MNMISIRLSEREAGLIRSYARLNGISVSDLVRNTVIRSIEDEIDSQHFANATKSLRTTFSLEELEHIVREDRHV